MNEFDDIERPRTREALRAWLREHLGLSLPTRAVIDGHNAPMEYLAHAYFADHAPAALGEAARPADAVVWANRGGGKTFLGAVATLLDMTFKPGIEIRILAGSLDQSRRMYAHLRRLLDTEKRPRLAAQVARMTESRLIFRNGSEVELLAQSHTSVRGTRVQKLRCDEVDLFKPEIWEAAQLTTRAALCGGVAVRGVIECLSTMHIPHGVMHDLVEEAKAGRRALFRWGVVDVLERCPPERACRGVGGEGGEAGECPLLNECDGRAKRLGDEGVEEGGHVPVDDAITMKGRVSLAAWESEMLCLRPRRTDAAVPEFDPALHVFRDDAGVRERAEAWVAGMDFGIRSPTVVLWAALMPGGEVRVVDERSVAGEVLASHVEAMSRGLARAGVPGWPRPMWVGIDPAGNMRSDQTGKCNAGVLREAGFEVRSRSSRIWPGLCALRARLAPALGRPTLFVHERCRVLVESLQRYRFDPGDPEGLRPVKGEGFDHSVDALRYLVMNLDHPVTTRVQKY